MANTDWRKVLGPIPQGHWGLARLSAYRVLGERAREHGVTPLTVLGSLISGAEMATWRRLWDFDNKMRALDSAKRGRAARGEQA